MKRNTISRRTVTYTMAEAEAKDKSSSTILKRLKETLRVRKYSILIFASPHTNTDFSRYKGGTGEDSRVFFSTSPFPDKNPTIVKRERDFSKVAYDI